MRFEGETLSVPKGADLLLRDLVHERTGLHYDGPRYDQMLERLAPLVLERGFQSYLDYYYLLKYDEEGVSEWPRVMNALSVPETYFWREADQFRDLGDDGVAESDQSLTTVHFSGRPINYAANSIFPATRAGILPMIGSPRLFKSACQKS